MWYNQYSIFGTQIWSLFGYGIFGSIFFLIAAVWLLFSIVLKGYALWHSAKRGQIWWFVALLIFNTLGILELIFIVFFLKKWPGKEDSSHHHHHNNNGNETHHEHNTEHSHDHEHIHNAS